MHLHGQSLLECTIRGGYGAAAGSRAPSIVPASKWALNKYLSKEGNNGRSDEWTSPHPIALRLPRDPGPAWKSTWWQSSCSGFQGLLGWCGASWAWAGQWTKARIVSLRRGWLSLAPEDIQAAQNPQQGLDKGVWGACPTGPVGPVVRLCLAALFLSLSGAVWQ